MALGLFIFAPETRDWLMVWWDFPSFCKIFWKEKKNCNMCRYVHRLKYNAGIFMKVQKCVYEEAVLSNQNVKYNWQEWMSCCLTNAYFHITMNSSFKQIYVAITWRLPVARCDYFFSLCSFLALLLLLLLLLFLNFSLWTHWIKLQQCRATAQHSS